ncbi:DgyrCDS8289 [Dimorphilus gyrociliatus]|uniref:DgyrCDS8289 n=1 Tax=Dimorphilus gyrociliatus TaxID=2664684 RepID=A0A7I8VTY6_9ANNE|nr:DgyrCDS8289 [Dimorphilus gyrociliatus]
MAQKKSASFMEKLQKFTRPSQSSKKKQPQTAPPKSKEPVKVINRILQTPVRKKEEERPKFGVETPKVRPNEKTNIFTMPASAANTRHPPPPPPLHPPPSFQRLETPKQHEIDEDEFRLKALIAESILHGKHDGLSEEQIKEYQEAFAVFDKDQDGIITKEELGHVLFAIGQRPTMKQIEHVLQRVSGGAPGVTFDQFVALMNQGSDDYDGELRQVFSVFDLNSDGVLSTDEVYHVMAQLSDKIKYEEVKEMVQEADSNGDGYVDFSEFKTILQAK